MDVIVLVGNLGSSLIYRLVSPVARVSTVHKVSVVCRYPGTEIIKLEYYCPQKFINRFALTAIIYELLTLFYLLIFKMPDCIIGHRIFPHGLIAFIAAKLIRRPVVISIISGPYELYAMGTRI